MAHLRLRSTVLTDHYILAPLTQITLRASAKAETSLTGVMYIIVFLEFLHHILKNPLNSVLQLHLC